MSGRPPRRRPVQVLPGQVWTGRKVLLGRTIRVTAVDPVRDRIFYEVLAGSRTSQPIKRHSLLISYELKRDPRMNPLAVNGEDLTVHEAQVIASFQRLADRWPATLKVVLMNGELAVLHADQPVQQDSVLETIRGIPGE